MTLTGRERVLQAATDAVMRDRNAEYAPPEQNFARIADLWNTYLEGRTITRYDVAIMCGLIKVARCISSPEQIDHLVDLAGYAACAGDIVLSETTAEPEPEPEPVKRGRRGTYEGQPGRLMLTGDQFTFYTDNGPKIPVSNPVAAERAGALTFEEDE